jgi:hypothetical protein
MYAEISLSTISYGGSDTVKALARQYAERYVAEAT